MSLSGSSTFYLNTWRAPLLSHGISHWHDNRSLEPLVYLGFPLSSNLSQRNSFLEKLLSKIRSACNMHSQRSLSVRGRVTILNTLILSKLWHVLRLVSAPLAFFDKLKSIMSSFLTYRMFPKISLSTMCAQRSKGGLGVLDPNIQQGALQLRWLMPLMAGSPFWPFSPVWSSAAIRNSIVLPRLLDFFLYHLETRHSIDARNNGQPYEYTDFRLSFLFPDLRPSSTRRLDGVFSLLFKSMDLLPKNYRDVVVNPETCVRLPVASIYTNTDGLTISRSINRLLAGISYTIDPISHVLRPKALTELSQHPILAKRILTLVHNGTIVLHPFFVRAFIPDRFSHLASPPFIPVQHQDVDATPFLESLPLQQEGPKRALSTKLYRHSCTFSKKPIKLPNNLLPVKWSAFWSFPLLHQSRNVWYRLLHQKLPFKSFLHRICPNFFPYAGCELCGLHEEDFLHFFLHCPLKIAVWQAIWLKFFTTSTFTPSAVLSALTLFKFPTLTSGVLDCPPSVVFGHTLLAIWRAQWSLAFDSVPFLPSRVITASYTLIQKSFDEHLVQHGMSHVPLPNIQF
ncbi:hypothetical protein G6F60_012567 [Rhizopus arrhizus]|nr:hypothetical protein G6F60_012567 [Rhizopus arrhizus]